MAEVLNEYCSSVFTTEGISSLPVPFTKFEGSKSEHLGLLFVTSEMIPKKTTEGISSPATSWNVVLVSGIKDTKDKDTLKEFFECKRRSRGGPVANIDYRKDTGEAVVTYFSEEGR